MTDMDIACHANAALSCARERGTPARTLAVPEETDLWALENDLVPRHLSFADAENALEPCKFEPQNPKALTIDTEATSAEPEDTHGSKKCKEAPKPFDITEIPSPTRNRAKRQA